MSIIRWLNPIAGTWATASNWNSGSVPGGADDVFIDASGTTYLVTSTQDNAAGTLTLGASATLAIDGNTTFTVNGNISNAGALDVTDNATLSIQDEIDNSGTIALQSTNFGTLLFVGGNGATLNGGGTVLLSDDSGNLIQGDGTLINVDNTISGSGLIGGHSAFGLVNHGVIDATGTNNKMEISTTIAVVNTGIIEASGTAPLVIKQTTIDNVGGVILAAGDGTHVVLYNATISSGSLGSTGSGFIQTFQPTGSGPSTLDGTSSPLAITGNLHIIDNTSLLIEGEIVNSGTIALQSHGLSTMLLVSAGGATLKGGGAISLGSGGSNFIEGNGTLTNADNTISGAGSFIASGGTFTLVNQQGGSIIATDAHSVLVLAAGVAVTNDGVLGEANSHLSIFGGVTGSGHLLLSGSGGTMELHANTNEGVLFAAGASGVLQLDYQDGSAGPATPGVIGGFGESDAVLFNGYAATGNDFVSYQGYNAADNTTTVFVSNGTETGAQLTGVTLVFSGQYLPDHFELTGIPGQSSLGLHTTAPQAPFFGDLGILNVGGTMLLAGVAEANALVALYDGASSIGMTTADGNGVWSFTTGSLSNVVHDFTATASDADGNVSAVSGTLQFGSTLPDNLTGGSGHDILSGGVEGIG